MSGFSAEVGLLNGCTCFPSVAAFKVPQMTVQEFVTGARLTIVRPSDSLAEGHLNCSSVEIAFRPNCGIFALGGRKLTRPAGLKVEAEGRGGDWFLGRGSQPHPTSRVWGRAPEVKRKKNVFVQV